MSNPVLERKTAALSGRGATVQGIAMITLLDLGFVVAAAMMAWQHPELNMVWHIEKSKTGRTHLPGFCFFAISRNISIHAEFNTFMTFCNFILI